MITTLSQLAKPEHQPLTVLDDRGKEIGSIEFSIFTERWFAKFRTGADSAPFVMGHGDNPEEAAQRAIRETRADLYIALKKVEQIEQAISQKVAVTE